MKFIIYGKDNCSFCENAKSFINYKGDTFTYYLLGKDYVLEDLIKLAPTAKSFPQIWQVNDDGNNNHIGGYDQLVEFYDLVFLDDSFVQDALGILEDHEIVTLLIEDLGQLEVTLDSKIIDTNSNIRLKKLSDNTTFEIHPKKIQGYFTND